MFSLISDQIFIYQRLQCNLHQANLTSGRLDPLPTKRSNAQHLVEYEKLLLYEENKKSGNVMQQSMDSYVCGTNLRSESYLVLSDLLFA